MRVFYLSCFQAYSKKKLWTCSIVGLSSGLSDQQRVIRSHKSSETPFFWSCPSGRGGHCLLLILAWMVVTFRGRLENGTSSVMHSSTSIANEYVPEHIVVETLFSTSSGRIPDNVSRWRRLQGRVFVDFVYHLRYSEVANLRFALPVRDQFLFYGSNVDVEFIS